MENTARMLPHNLEAEQSVLGCIFISEQVQGSIFERLRADDFYINGHKKIYNAMIENYRRNINIDYITVSNALRESNEMDDIGGLDYLLSLTNVVPSAGNSEYYVDIVKNDSICRQIIESSQSIIANTFDKKSAIDCLQFAEKTIMDISKEQQKTSLTHISRGLTEVIDRMEKVSVDKTAFKGMLTGYKKLDAVTNGLQRSDLILLAARPSVGKTAFAMNIANNAATMYGKTVAVFSLEMPDTQIAARAIASIGMVPLGDVKNGSNDQGVWDGVLQAKDKISKAKIYIDHSSVSTPIDVLSKCRKLKREQGLDLVVIDYLQLMNSGSGKRNDNRQQEISDMTRTLKIAARELDVPILLLSQLSRSIETRPNKTPMLSDLRESGAIEQDADIVMFISKKSDMKEANKYDSAADEIATVGESDDDRVLTIAKHRNGELATIPLCWAGQYVKFYDEGDRTMTAAKRITADDIQTTKISDDSLPDPF